MKKLPVNFELDRYGLHVRLVREEDAELIVKLRTNPKISRYLSHVDDDVEKQKSWIREYKKREAEGIDYYFLFSKDGEPIVLCRLYNIDRTHLTFTGGSWVSVPDTDGDSVLTCSVIVDEIAYDMLGLLVDIYDVRKGNTQVLNYHRKIVCAFQYGETELDYLFMSTPETRKNSKLRRLLGL